MRVLQKSPISGKTREESERLGKRIIMSNMAPFVLYVVAKERQVVPKCLFLSDPGIPGVRSMGPGVCPSVMFG